jgi:hypothetical protein
MEMSKREYVITLAKVRLAVLGAAIDRAQRRLDAHENELMNELQEAEPDTPQPYIVVYPEDRLETAGENERIRLTFVVLDLKEDHAIIAEQLEYVT